MLIICDLGRRCLPRMVSQTREMARWAQDSWLGARYYSYVFIFIRPYIFAKDFQISNTLGGSKSHKEMTGILKQNLRGAHQVSER